MRGEASVGEAILGEANVDVHGVRAAVVRRGAYRDPLSELLERFGQPPFAAELEARDPALRVELLASTEAPAPRFATSSAHAPLFWNGGLQGYRAPGGDVLLTLVDGASRVLIRSEGRDAVSIVAAFAPDAPHAHGAAAMLAQIALAFALRHVGLFHLHAGAARSPAGDGVVVVGPSGSGKTTTVLALVEAGYAFVADDSVLLARGSPVVVGALPRPFHASAATLGHFPRLTEFVGAPYGLTGKREVDAAAAYADRQIARVVGPRLVLFPRVEDVARSSARPLDQAGAMAELLAASPAFAIDGAPRQTESIAAVADLARSAAAFELVLGRDADREPAVVVPALVEALLAKLPGAPPGR